MNENITSALLRSLNPVSFPKNARAFSRYSFWQYTRLEVADLILSTSCFRISNLNGMNDLAEAKLHEKDRNRVFALCFCNSDTEKIPLWYLYSGLTGNGAALGFTAGKMLKWLRSIQTVRGVKKGQNKEDGVPLRVGADVELRYGWVYYQHPREPYNIFYRNNWYTIDDVETFQKDNYFIKSYPWEYEREFRILFLNNTSEDYDYLFVDIPVDIRNVAKVMLAPELQEDQFKNISGLKCIGTSHQPIYSKLSIRMNLLSRNSECLFDYLKKELMKDNPSINAESLCNVLQETDNCKK